MPAPRADRPRSGCALVAGMLLIAAGTLLLAHNLFGYTPWGWIVPALGWLSVYWPAILIAWGAYKIYQRARRPETARVSGLEIVALFLLLVVGLGLRAGRYVAVELELDEIAALAGVDALGATHRFTEERTFEVEEETTTLTVVNDRGAIRVRGWDEPRIQAVLTKHVRHAREAEAERIAGDVDVEIATRSAESELRLERKRGDGGERSADAELELALSVPRRLSLRLSNRRGPVTVYDMRGGVSVSTRDDPVEVEDVLGDVEASTTHAPLRLDRLAGSVRARNRHGSITASRVEGDLTAETRNGAVRVEEVRGAVTVHNRHASVRAHRIGGELRIDGLNSDIDVEEAGAGVVVESSNRSVFVRDVAGRLAVDTRNARITARGARGGMQVENRYGSVAVSDSAGPVTVDAPQSSIVVDGVRGDVSIRNSHESVSLSNVEGAVDVRSAHAPVRVSASRVDADILVHTSYADVTLRLPAPPDAGIELRTRTGELRSGWPAIDWTERETDAGKLWTRAGRSEPAAGGSIDVVTSYGDIVLQDPEK